MSDRFDYSLMFDLLLEHGCPGEFGEFEVVTDRSKWDERDVRTVASFHGEFYNNIRLGDLGMNKGGEWEKLETDIKAMYFHRFKCYKYKPENEK